MLGYFNKNRYFSKCRKAFHRLIILLILRRRSYHDRHWNFQQTYQLLQIFILQTDTTFCHPCPYGQGIMCAMNAYPSMARHGQTNEIRPIGSFNFPFSITKIMRPRTGIMNLGNRKNAFRSPHITRFPLVPIVQPTGNVCCKQFFSLIVYQPQSHLLLGNKQKPGII